MRTSILAFCLTALLFCTSFTHVFSQTQELEMPALPDSLRTPSERAAFLTLHFWDALDFGNDSRSNDSGFLEQAFVNFLSVLPIAEKEAQAAAVSNLMRRAEANQEAYNAVARLADKYLYSPDSPMASDDIYELFLTEITGNDAYRSPMKVLYVTQLDQLRKNRVGTQAADFSFKTLSGEDVSLYNSENGKKVILIFYDPDCDHCKDVLATLSADKDINSLISSGTLGVIAVYSGDEEDLWRQSAAAMPQSWTIGYEDGTVQDDDVYVIRMMPTIYLLDSDKKVIIKEADIDSLLNYLKTEQ